jgi:molybdate transport system substrate-binding protein
MLAAVFISAVPSIAPGAQTVTVFAAASLKNALEEAGRAFTAKSGIKVVGVFASSSTLARQIERGAPADLYVAANVKWMDYLQGRNAIDAGTRVNLLRNRLVLIAPGSSQLSVRIQKGFPLDKLLGDGRLAMGDPDHVPAGIYGKAALVSLGVWQSVEPKVARADNVRAALALVARGEARLGIVYATDARGDPGVTVLGELPGGSYPDIVYPAAVTARAPNRIEAQKLLRFLRSREAGAIFERHGFTVVR